ncbi:hypothetical protein Pint_31539 [Pistacia integerrima]|uniref:Uncharacterized protein n=1 Tax=Pistacia integerrima TaxID=434235 RepID=A0ACC0XPM4_9ROSI|nr:hypothetical protein Pint_31539 [Pistacia integerrima]
MKLTLFSKLLLLSLLASLNFIEANQADNLQRLIKSKRWRNSFQANSQEESSVKQEYSPVYIGTQDGSMELDKITTLPGQPNGINFSQYSGYVTVDPQAGRALFYYFVESPHNSSTNPLVLWLNGVANVIFLESPAGVGFSYSNTSSDYDHSGDNTTAVDAYTFLVNWLERFPQYKTRDFFITGESYAGHYVPQLANTIRLHNKYLNQTVINLKGIAIGNGVLNYHTDVMGEIDYLWTHALMSDESYKGIYKYCDFVNRNFSEKCVDVYETGWNAIGDIDPYNIYAPLCHDVEPNNAQKKNSIGSVKNFDPCSDNYVKSYLNIPEVQAALHAKNTKWQGCSGDIDSVVPVTSSRYSISTLNLPIKAAWYPWYTNEEVAGYVEAYDGLTFVTVRGAGHLVPSYQPERALTMISSFLNGVLPPSK